MITIELTEDEARLFREFQRRHDVIAPIIGYFDSLGVIDLRSTNMMLDIDERGVIKHMAITKHYRP